MNLALLKPTPFLEVRHPLRLPPSVLLLPWEGRDRTGFAWWFEAEGFFPHSLEGQSGSLYKGARKDRTVYYSSVIEEKNHPGCLVSALIESRSSHAFLLLWWRIHELLHKEIHKNRRENKSRQLLQSSNTPAVETSEIPLNLEGVFFFRCPL